MYVHRRAGARLNDALLGQNACSWRLFGTTIRKILYYAQLKINLYYFNLWLNNITITISISARNYQCVI